MQSRFQKLIKRTLLCGLTAVFPLVSWSWGTPAVALTWEEIWSDVYERYRNEFDPEVFRECAELLTNAEIVESQVAIACAEALDPEDLSFCVDEISTFTAIDPLYTLFGCFRTRRPVELAHCVVDIHYNVLMPKTFLYQDDDRYNLNDRLTPADKATLEPVALSTLDHCRRSLLPERFSACVVGLSTEVSFSSEQLLGTCIRADDFPTEIYAPRNNSTLEQESF